MLLNLWTNESASCAQALALRPDATALVYAANACRLVAANANLQDLAGIYEVRLFDPEVEVRWVEGRGAMFLSEAALAPQDWQQRTIPFLETMEQRYLLWGAVDTVAAAEVTMFDYRIGYFRAPMAGAVPGQRLALLAREYLGVDFDGTEPYGNVAVVAERLLKVEVVNE